MSFLTDLTERLEKLPQQRKRKSRNARVETLTGKISEARLALERSSEAIALAMLVFPDEPFNAATKAVRAAGRQAGKLKEKLEADFAEITTSATENKVTQLGERAKAVVGSIGKAWLDQMQKQTAPYEKLAEVAATLQLPGGGGLNEVMQRLVARTNQPPSTRILRRFASRLRAWGLRARRGNSCWLLLVKPAILATCSRRK
jgi:hypothetical protein